MGVTIAGGTKIEWADFTFNPWWGCEKVSPGCAHCYALGEARRRRPNARLWGTAHDFKFMAESTWAKPLAWARNAPTALGRRPRVFCASMADIFEERNELDEHRRRLFKLIEATPELDWLVLTKRPEPARDWLRARYWPFGGLPALAHMPGTHACPKDAPAGVYPSNLWIGVSIENSRFTWRADVLREIPAAVRFISAEPLLGSLFTLPLGRSPQGHSSSAGASPVAQPATPAGATPSVGDLPGRRPLDLTRIDWVIIGGESGHAARPMRIEWAREILEAVDEQQVVHDHHVALFMKQLGAKPVGGRVDSTSYYHPISDRKGGNLNDFPVDLRVREFPRGAAV